MPSVDPLETLLAGKWIRERDGIVGDETCRRIREYGPLVKIGADWSGWETLYRDPSDGRFWEVTYPQGEMQGGGPPQLQNLTPEKAAKQYGPDVLRKY